VSIIQALARSHKMKHRPPVHAHPSAYAFCWRIICSPCLLACANADDGRGESIRKWYVVFIDLNGTKFVLRMVGRLDVAGNSQHGLARMGMDSLPKCACSQALLHQMHKYTTFIETYYCLRQSIV